MVVAEAPALWGKPSATVLAPPLASAPLFDSTVPVLLQEAPKAGRLEREPQVVAHSDTSMIQC